MCIATWAFSQSVVLENYLSNPKTCLFYVFFWILGAEVIASRITDKYRPKYVYTYIWLKDWFLALFNFCMITFYIFISNLPLLKLILFWCGCDFYIWLVLNLCFSCTDNYLRKSRDLGLRRFIYFFSFYICSNVSVQFFIIIESIDNRNKSA